jgi:hypothetical protein
MYFVGFFDPIALSLGSLFIAWGGAAWYTGKRSLPALIIPMMLGFGLVYLAMRLFFQFDLVLALKSAIENGSGLYGPAKMFTPPRYYVPWLLPNLFGFLLSTGIGTSLACLGYVLLGNWKVPGALTFVATVATVALLDLSGVIRGEVERLWICAMPLLAIVAADVLRDRPVAQVTVLSSIICQTAATIWMVSFIGVPSQPVARPLAWF